MFSRRPYAGSSSRLCRHFTSPPVAPSAVLVPRRSVLSVTGPAAPEFLQGLTTRNVIPAPTVGLYSAFLHAQGRVLFDTFIYPIKEGFLIEYDSLPSPSLVALLKRYVLRSHVKVRDVADQWDVWALFGGYETPPQREWKWGPGGAVEPVWEHDEATDQISAVDWRAPGMGKRIVMPKGQQPPLGDHVVVDAMSYTLHRFLLGVPEGSVEIPYQSALPLDSNIDMMGGIDFRKGCYVGQELTVRTYHTGVVRKRVWPVSLYRAGEKPPSSLSLAEPPTPLPPPQTAIQIPGKSARVKGRLLNVSHNVGLALLPLPTEDAPNGSEQEMVVDWNDDDGWRIMPRRPDWWPVRQVS